MDEKDVIFKEIGTRDEVWIEKKIVLKVPTTKKFPLGIKAKFVLYNRRTKKCHILVDNHDEEFFHYHPHLPEDHDVREQLKTTSCWEAMAFFNQKVEEFFNEKN